jgi:hypothetical protein
MKIDFFLFVCFVLSSQSVHLTGQKCKLTHATAISKFKEAGILIHPIGGCPTRGNKDCPSLEQLRCRSMEGIVALKKAASKCSIVITGKEVEKNLKKKEEQKLVILRDLEATGRVISWIFVWELVLTTILNTRFNILEEEETERNNGNQLLEMFTQRKENIGTLHSTGNKSFNILVCLFYEQKILLNILVEMKFQINKIDRFEFINRKPRFLSFLNSEVISFKDKPPFIASKTISFSLKTCIQKRKFKILQEQYHCHFEFLHLNQTFTASKKNFLSFQILKEFLFSLTAATTTSSSFCSSLFACLSATLHNPEPVFICCVLES